MSVDTDAIKRRDYPSMRDRPPAIVERGDEVVCVRVVLFSVESKTKFWIEAANASALRDVARNGGEIIGKWDQTPSGHPGWIERRYYISRILKQDDPDLDVAMAQAVRSHLNAD